MNNNSGALSFEALLETGQLDRATRHVNNQLRDIGNVSERESKRMDAAFRKASIAVGSYFTFQAAKQFVSDIVRVRNEFQQLEIAFTTMLKSKQQADQLVAEIADIAATTPFGMKDVANGTKMLLAYGSEVANVREEITRLGDIAAGVGAPINDLIYLYGTLRTQGRAYAQDIRQFAGRGIPIYEELAKVLQINTSEVAKFVEEGKVGFKEVEQALKNMTAAGTGQFAGLMDAQSKSIGGSLERLGDAWDMMLNKIGQDSEGTINRSIQAVSSLVENYETVGKVVAGLVATYGTYKAAVITVSALEKARYTATLAMGAAEKTLTTWQGLRFVATQKLIAAQTLLNRVSSANPYILLATAVVGVATAIWALRDATDGQSAAQKRLNEENEKSKEFYQGLKSDIQDYIRTIQDETSTQFDKVRAYEALSRIAPGITKGFSLLAIKQLDAATASKTLNAAMNDMELEGLKGRVSEATAELERLENVLSDKLASTAGSKNKEAIVKPYKDAVDEQKRYLDQLRGQLDDYAADLEKAREFERIKTLPLKEQIKHYEQIRDELKAQKDALETTLLLANNTSTAFGNWQQNLNGNVTRLNVIAGQIANINAGLAGLSTAGDAPKNKVFWEKELEDAKSRFEKALPGTADFKAAKAEIDAANKALEAWNTTSSKTKPVEIFPKGSLAEISRQITAAEEALSKIPTNQTARVAKMQETILNLTKQRVEAEKIVEVRTWEESLEYKRKLYEEYERAIAPTRGESFSAYDLATADHAKMVFADLLKGGQSYKQYLESQILPLQDQLAKGTISKQGFSQLVTMTSELNTILGVSSPMEQYNERLTRMQDEAVNTAGFISSLEEELTRLNNVDASEQDGVWAAQLKVIKDKLKEARKSAAEELKTFLQQLRAHEEARLAIVNRYAGLREQAEKEGKSTAGIDQAERQELAAFAQEANEHFIKLNETIYDPQTRRGLEQRAKDTQAYFESVRDDAQYTKQQVEEAQAVAKDAKNELEAFNLSVWETWANVIGNASDEFTDMEGTIGAIANLLSGATRSASDIARAMKSIKLNDGQMTGEAAAAGVGAGLNLIGLVVNASKKRKAKRQQESYNTLQVQLDLNRALNEEIRLRTVLSESVYFSDYYGRITDSMNAMTDASRKAMSALIGLELLGEAKNGTVNKIDWGAVGTGAGSGATAGAVLGSIIPGLGNVVGAVVGGIVGGLVGLFGAMKTDSRFAGLFDLYPNLISEAGEFNDELAQTLIANDQLTDKTKQYLQQLIDMNEAWEEAKQQITDVVEELTGQMGGDLRDALVGAFEEGTSAAEAFAGAVERTLENALSNLIFSAVFSRAFADLQANIENSLMGSGQSLQSVFADFMEQSEELNKAFEEAMKAAQEEGKKFGYDLFNPDDADRANGLTGQIQGITEETASLIAGQMNAIRITQADTQEIIRQQLFHLARISANTEYNSNLVAIERHLSRMQSAQYWRDMGVSL